MNSGAFWLWLSLLWGHELRFFWVEIDVSIGENCSLQVDDKLIFLLSGRGFRRDWLKLLKCSERNWWSDLSFYGTKIELVL